LTPLEGNSSSAARSRTYWLVIWHQQGSGELVMQRWIIQLVGVNLLTREYCAWNYRSHAVYSARSRCCHTTSSPVSWHSTRTDGKSFDSVLSNRKQIGLI
jgi:hypothetical protein